MTPDLSVVICTLDQADYLRKALGSLAGQTLAQAEFEVIVVDNGSTDPTRQAVASFRAIENLRYAYDPVPGLSRARNLGWQEARGRYVAYLDDDAEADPKWLERILFRFETLRPRPAGVGGRILPIWDAEKPAWLGEELEPYVGIVDWPTCPRILDETRFYLAGANVGYERRALRESGGFPTDLGRKGPLLLSNEELWMQRFLMSRGRALWYDPEILVHHHIRAERLTRSWFYRRFFWQGVSDALLEDRLARRGVPKRFRPRRAWHDLSGTARDSVRFLAARLAGNGDIVPRCRLHERMGRMLQGLRLAFPGSRSPASLRVPQEP